MDIHALFLILDGRVNIQTFTSRYDVSRRFFVDAVYKVEETPI